MNDIDFERIVAEALDALPQFFQDRMDNVEIVVEEWPDQETMRLAGVKQPAELLGFYHGVPLTERGQGYTLVLPDKVSIYRQPILMQCHTWEEVRATIHRVVRHELAHHFGIDDDRLRQLGAY
jgi:predicted Zn-dependent protease with MMP-like domain